MVLDDVEILAQLIKIKEKKNIEIIAGPNLMIMPDEYNKILFRDEINKIIVPCDWVKKKYIEVSKSHLKNKIKIWAAGVDHKYWKPGKNKSIDVLLYSKFIRNDKIFEKCFKYLKNRKYRVKIIEYGNYDQKKYLNLLKKSKVAVFFSESESQGLAYFEAWSTNVPTLIYNPKKIYRKPYKTKTDSCPYLNQKLGKDFYTFKSFKIEFQNFFNSKNFKPRSEIIKNFTIEKTAEKLSKII